jgi:peptidoglycan/LPS O-acetylase OafA/YrhL
VLSTEQSAVALRRPELDGLRGLAALIVVLSHVSNATGLWNKLFGVGGGQIGVMLFFVLSGYLMGALYLDQPFTRERVWAYSIHRVARVLPLFYFVVLLALGLNIVGTRSGIDIGIFPIIPGNALLHFGLISGQSVFWTIPVEVHFYVLFVFLWWLYTRSQIVLFLVIAIAIVLHFFIPIDAARYFNTLLFTGAFFLSGVLISRARGLHDKPGGDHLRALGLAGFFLLALLLFPNVYQAVFGEQRWLQKVHLLQMWHDPLYLIAIAGCLFAALTSQIVAKALSCRFMTYSGKISYSIYLLHLPVIVWIDRLTPLRESPEIFLLIVVLATIALASTSYRFVEAPLRRLVNKTFAGRTDRAGAHDTASATATSAGDRGIVWSPEPVPASHKHPALM